MLEDLFAYCIGGLFVIKIEFGGFILCVYQNFVWLLHWLDGMEKVYAAAILRSDGNCLQYLSCSLFFGSNLLFCGVYHVLVFINLLYFPCSLCIVMHLGCKLTTVLFAEVLPCGYCVICKLSRK
jgi:hypothetical protein